MRGNWEEVYIGVLFCNRVCGFVVVYGVFDEVGYGCIWREMVVV